MKLKSILIAYLIAASSLAFAHGSSHPKKPPPSLDSVAETGAAHGPCMITLPDTNQVINANLLVSVYPYSYSYVTEFRWVGTNPRANWYGVKIVVGNSAFQWETNNSADYIARLNKLVKETCQ